MTFSIQFLRGPASYCLAINDRCIAGAVDGGASLIESFNGISLQQIAPAIPELADLLADHSGLTETAFWSILDRHGLANVSSDAEQAIRELAEAYEPHELFYLQLAEDGTAIRKWSRAPFEGARKCRVALDMHTKAPKPVRDATTCTSGDA